MTFETAFIIYLIVTPILATIVTAAVRVFLEDDRELDPNEVGFCALMTALWPIILPLLIILGTFYLPYRFMCHVFRSYKKVFWKDC